MSNKKLRQTARIFHIIEAFVLAVLVYGPWGDGSLLELSIQYLFFPALVISGILMWQQPRITKFFRSKSA